jgi:hypothetical protein
VAHRAQSLPCLSGGQHSAGSQLFEEPQTDVINEPSGYSPTAFINLVVEWMGKFLSVSKNRVVVDGSYNDTNVNPHGGDARLAGCILNLHIYAIGSTDTSEASWTTKLTNAVGPI